MSTQPAAQHHPRPLQCVRTYLHDWIFTHSRHTHLSSTPHGSIPLSLPSCWSQMEFVLSSQPAACTSNKGSAGNFHIEAGTRCMCPYHNGHVRMRVCTCVCAWACTRMPALACLCAHVSVFWVSVCSAQAALAGPGGAGKPQRQQVTYRRWLVHRRWLVLYFLFILLLTALRRCTLPRRMQKMCLEAQL